MAKTPITPSASWVANGSSPQADQNYKAGDRPAGGGDEVWTATTDYDHGNPGILQFSTSRSEISSAGDVTINIERVGGYAGAVGCTVRTNSTTGDMAMTSGVNFTAVAQSVTFDDQQAGVKSVIVPVTSFPRAGLNLTVVTMDTPTGSVRLRNPEHHIYCDDGGVNPNATVFDGADSATLQATINAGGAGKMYYFRDNNGVFVSNERLSGQSESGFNLQNGASGTQFAKTMLVNYPGESPVIDQNYAGSSDGLGNDRTVGFYLAADYVHIKGFEIQKTKYCGVMSDAPGETGLVVEDCTIHDCGNTPNGIADFSEVFHADNIGGIRLDLSTGAIVRNNTVYETYDPRVTTISPVTGANTNAFTAYPASFHSGIHGYRLGDFWVHNNTIYHVQKALFSKQSNELGDFAWRVNDNHIYEIEEQGVSLGVQGAGNDVANDVHIYRNLFDFSNANCVSVDAYLNNRPTGETNQNAVDYWYYNNTQIGGRDSISGRDSDNQVAYNNIMDSSNTARFWIIDGRGVNTNDINYSDFNCFPSGFAALTNRNNGANNYATLAAWQAAYPGDAQLLRDCDESSIETTPTYVGGTDYRTLSGVTVGAGRFGRDIGIGSTVVGAQ